MAKSPVEIVRCIKPAETIDIPPHINQELERLHTLMLKALGRKVLSMNGKTLSYIDADDVACQWAKGRIERIHNILFDYAPIVKDK